MGGPITAVQEGNRIEIGIPGKRLKLPVSEEELKARLARLETDETRAERVPEALRAPDPLRLHRRNVLVPSDQYL